MFFKSNQIIFLCFILAVFLLPAIAQQPDEQIFILKAENLQDEKSVDLTKAGWKYQSGDDSAWVNPQFDDSGWEKLEETKIKPEMLEKPDWNGRSWFRLHFKVEESLAEKRLALIAYQTGASEIYLDGQKLQEFGKITDSEISEYNPKGLPIPIRFENSGEHVLAVRFASKAFADTSSIKAKWMINGGISPEFVLMIRNADDVGEVISRYSNNSSMRIGFFFIGVLLSLALLHFLLYLFYRVERGNLFYSIYVAAFAFFLLCGNFIYAGHQSIFATFILGQIRTIMFAVLFVALLIFLHVAFKRQLGKLFWILTGLWIINTIASLVLLNSLQVLGLFVAMLIGLTFAFFIFILVQSLRKKKSGAWILMGGIQVFSLGMLSILMREFFKLDLPELVAAVGEISLILAVPVAVSIFLARNFANTNRNLKSQLEQVEFLSQKQIEQEKHTAKLQAENERRAQELEEARELQFSMLPKKLPIIPNLEIAAYMKPATEVGGDYYDFHVGKDGTLTVAVGDATGHGLKAGTVVTATKGLFNNLASAPDIPDTLQQISRSLKAMNLRGLFMAMTLLKIKNNRISISAAGMPSTIIYRHATGEIEKIDLRALPLGGIAGIKYKKQEFALEPNDLIVLMSDGFPEMFNDEGEMLGDEEADNIIRENPNVSPQEIIDHLIAAAENWAGGRPQDDDVTFVVLKAKT